MRIVVFSLLILAFFDLYAQQRDRRIVVADNVNVRDSNKMNSRVLIKLKKTNVVTVEKELDERETIDGIEGKWIYVDTGFGPAGKPNDKKIKGWVFSRFLVKREEFTKVLSFREFFIKGWIGDFLLDYTFFKDGSYKREKYDYEKNSQIAVSGKLFQYETIYEARDDGEKAGILFYIRKDGKFCSQYDYCEK